MSEHYEINDIAIMESNQTATQSKRQNLIIMLCLSMLFVVVFILTAATQAFSTHHKSSETLAPIVKTNELINIGTNLYIRIKEVKVRNDITTVYFHIINSNNYELVFPSDKLKLGYRSFHGSMRSQLTLESPKLLADYEVAANATVIYQFDYKIPKGIVPISVFSYHLDYNRCVAQISLVEN